MVLKRSDCDEENRCAAGGFVWLERFLFFLMGVFSGRRKRTRFSMLHPVQVFKIF
jgi:hypothetical protein